MGLIGLLVVAESGDVGSGYAAGWTDWFGWMGVG